MRITKKLIKLGRSKAVTIPNEWLLDQERINKNPINEVIMEINGKIVISVIKKGKEVS